MDQERGVRGNNLLDKYVLVGKYSKNVPHTNINPQLQTGPVELTVVYRYEYPGDPSIPSVPIRGIHHVNKIIACKLQCTYIQCFLYLSTSYLPSYIRQSGK